MKKIFFILNLIIICNIMSYLSILDSRNTLKLLGNNGINGSIQQRLENRNDINMNLFNSIDYKFISKWVIQDNKPSNLFINNSITVDQRNNIYVAVSFNYNLKFDSNGKLLFKWYGVPNYTYDNGVIYDSKRNIANPEDIIKIGEPIGITVDNMDNVYIGYYIGNSIQKFDSNGKFITEWKIENHKNNKFTMLSNISIDLENNIYITDFNSIYKFNSNGNFILNLEYDKNLKNISFHGIVIDSKSNIYLTDNKNNYIEKINSNGVFLSKWYNNGFSYGIAKDLSDNIYISNYNNNCIVKTDSNGNFITQWGSEGTGDGQFKNPTGITVDGQGNVYVMDTGNYRIQKFAPKIQE